MSLCTKYSLFFITLLGLSATTLYIDYQDLHNQDFSKYTQELAQLDHSKTKTRIEKTIRHFLVTNRIPYPSQYSFETQIEKEKKWVVLKAGTHKPVYIDYENYFYFLDEVSLFKFYLVNQQGVILNTGDQKLYSTPVSMLHYDKKSEGILNYKDQAGKSMIAFFTKFPQFGLSLITETPKHHSMARNQSLKKSKRMIGGGLLIACIIIGWVVAFSQTSRLNGLKNMVRNLKFKNKMPRPSDPLQELTLALSQISHHFQESDHLRSTIGRLNYKNLGDAIASGKVELGGEKKDVVILFADIRRFADLCKLHSPEKVVQILNRFFSLMVRIILNHGGSIDKFLGDAVMAVWGIPNATPEDPAQAVLAALEMRKALVGFNAELISEGLKPLHFGMGINLGSAIAGNLGSDERMEYTVIGEAVNTASRVETLTSTSGTDLLISQAVLNQIGERFIVKKAIEARVKGNTNPITAYKVLGYYTKNGEKIIIQTDYSHYEPMPAEKILATTGPAAPPPFLKKTVKTLGGTNTTIDLTVYFNEFKKEESTEDPNGSSEAA